MQIEMIGLWSHFSSLDIYIYPEKFKNKLDILILQQIFQFSVVSKSYNYAIFCIKNRFSRLQWTPNIALFVFLHF